jgi:hypothetical protein
MTNSQLLDEAAIIKNETESGANTAQRVGQMLEDIINYSGGNYKVYTATLTQTGTDAPTGEVLQNTLGYEISWLYDSVGYYYSNVSSFNLNSLVFIQNNTGIDNGYTNITATISGNYVVIYTNTDGILNKTPIEIRVYE